MDKLSTGTATRLELRMRRSAERARFDHGWLDTRHTFSFGDYFDPQWVSFRSLRVINEDHVALGGGFPTHPHREMEIVTYVVSGELEHTDSTGNVSRLLPGGVQHMTAGRGIYHSEGNPSREQAAHFLQIWLLPWQRALPPGYEERQFSRMERQGQLRPIVTLDGRQGSLSLAQDAAIYASLLDTGQAVRHELRGERHVWVQLVSGALQLTCPGAAGQSAKEQLSAGDGVGLSGCTALELSATDNAELLLFDLA